MEGICDIGIKYPKKEPYALTPVFSGEEKCTAGHYWGAGVRASYVIHYVISGEGDQISRSVVSDSLRPHESQHARPPCPSPTPGVHSDSRPLSQ